MFKEISELFVMVPALLGLKGNLEMTLAARLSTALNIGDLSATKKWKVIGANLALTQAQAVVVGFLASAFAVFIGVISHHSINWGHALLLCGAASVTTSVASSVLGTNFVTFSRVTLKVAFFQWEYYKHEKLVPLQKLTYSRTIYFSRNNVVSL